MQDWRAVLYSAGLEGELYSAGLEISTVQCRIGWRYCTERIGGQYSTMYSAGLAGSTVKVQACETVHCSAWFAGYRISKKRSY